MNTQEPSFLYKIKKVLKWIFLGEEDGEVIFETPKSEIPSMHSRIDKMDDCCKMTTPTTIESPIVKKDQPIIQPKEKSQPKKPVEKVVSKNQFPTKKSLKRKKIKI